MRIIFAGTPDFAVPPLEALLAQHDVVAVFTQPDRRAGRGKKITMPPVKELAQQREIPVFQPASLRKDLQNIATQIEQFKPDVMVVVAYGMILPQAILDIPRLGCINIHASILPRWRGAAPIQRAIAAGDAETGVSIMQMEAGLDTGPVFQILRTPISTTDTAASMHDQLAKLGAQGIIETLTRLAEDPSTQPIVQDEGLATHAAKLSKAEAQIDWQADATELQARIRAFNPWPICQTHHVQNCKSNRIRLWQASVDNDIEDHVEGNSAAAGTIVAINENAITVACGSGLLNLETLQRDGGKPLAAREFCNGYALGVGDQFDNVEQCQKN